MANYTKEIMDNWDTDILNQIQKITSLSDTSFPAWTIKEGVEFGVLIPCKKGDVYESFSSARIYSRCITMNDGTSFDALLLVSSSVDIKDIFATLCDAFITPGEDGEKRKKLIADPVKWWKHWKELLGNKNVDTRIYDVLGELLILKILLARNYEDVVWHGPDFATYDIETDTGFFEVKSTLSRAKREITVNNEFQVIPPGRTLNLILCLFEPVVELGISIDSVISEIHDLGCDVSNINMKLSSMGLDEGRSDRKRLFMVHDILCYSVDENFPHLDSNCFVGGTLPDRISIDTYKINLDNLPNVSWVAEL